MKVRPEGPEDKGLRPSAFGRDRTRTETRCFIGEFDILSPKPLQSLL